MVSKVQGSFEALDSRMKEYLLVVKQVMSQFTKAKVVQVARGQNRHANSLTTLVSSMTEDVPRIIKVELIVQSSIDAAIGVVVVSTFGPCWMDPIINFLAEDQVPDDEKKANRVRQVAARYWLSADHKLYWRFLGGSYLLCLCHEKVNELLAELHDGVCCSYVKGRSLTHRVMTQGFWWP